MKILFLSRLYLPHIGGVEKHISNIGIHLINNGFKITVVTEKYAEPFKDEETIDGIKVIRFSYPHIKFLGLVSIWIWLFKNIKLIKESDIIHCHDVFIWYLPFRFLFPFKPVYTTFHGWEGKYPISLISKIIKKITAKLSSGYILVGDYLKKYFELNSKYITYGGVDADTSKVSNKDKNRIMFLGRLDKDTGVHKFIEMVQEYRKTHKEIKVDFCGDGPLRNVCEKYGSVHGFVDSKEFLSKSYICFASGYLSALEALSSRCIFWVGYDNPLKEDYWKLSPFWKYVDNPNTLSSSKWARLQTWEKVSKMYMDLWRVNP